MMILFVKGFRGQDDWRIRIQGSRRLIFSCAPAGSNLGIGACRQPYSRLAESSMAKADGLKSDSSGNMGALTQIHFVGSN